jgi:hypothetical protein
VWRFALLFALLAAAGCSTGDPLEIAVERSWLAGPAQLQEWGRVLFVQVDAQNRGDENVHVFTDLLQVVGDDGARGTVRDFRDRYRLRQARTEDAGERRRFEEMFARHGVTSSGVRELVAAQVEIPPGQHVRRVLPFLLNGPADSSRFRLEMAYHDDATDRVHRFSLTVRAD